MERILSATSEVLREGGLELLTTSRVAERAGSTLPSVYRYFPDRTHLVRAVAEHYLDAIYDRLAADLVGLRTAEDARAALETALRNYYQAFIDDPALREIWAGTIADRALLGLNIADSQRNGAVLADRLRPFSTLDTEALLRRCVLVAHLAQATVVFAVALDSSEGPSYVDEFGAWATDLLQG
ncbi:TetR family transcriptional regulator [Mycolicibacterium sp.]|uniref:TetR family transcriptional regulator n=1 Tax=Mycolicibacterium sp. TaxID=2320850 RepID=UPI003D0E0706